MSNTVVTKPGIQTVEFWLTIVATGLLAIWPDFPKEGFLAIITWAAGRSAQKWFGFVDPESGKASWQTSEFWVAIIFAVATAIFPDLPPESLYSVMGWVGLRTGIKVRADRINNGYHK